MKKAAAKPFSSELRDSLQMLLFPFARRFIAGETLEDALKVLQGLKRRGFLTTLDHLGESVIHPDAAARATEQYCIILKALREAKLDVNVSVKPTQLGLAISRELFEHNLRRLIATAIAQQGFVRVDIEGSATTTATFETIIATKEKNAPLGAAVQAMLRRTPNDVMKLLAAGIPLRLCKGAYKESTAVAHQDMSDIRQAYVALAKRLLTSKFYQAIATHDPLIIEEIKAFSQNQGISRSAFEFQMLYGVKPRLQQQIIDDGFRLRIYVPFGESWMPYVYRRLRERKENIWFVVKNLFQK